MNDRKYISSKAKIHQSAFVGNNVRLFGKVTIGANCFIDDNVVIGYPSRQSLIEMTKTGSVPDDLKFLESESMDETVIEQNCCIRYGTVISSQTRLSKGIHCDVRTLIGTRCSIGENTQLLYGARLYNDVQVGNNCRVGGFCCDRSVIEDSVSMFGDLVHSYREPVGGLIEPSPMIKQGATVGWGAIIIGGITIGFKSYIGAGAIVTKNVDSNQVVILNDENCYSRSVWRGNLSGLEED